MKHQCTNPSESVLCVHVTETQLPDVLRVENFVTQDAFCFACARAIFSADVDEKFALENTHGACLDCFASFHIPVTMAANGIWERQEDGKYLLVQPE